MSSRVTLFCFFGGQRPRFAVENPKKVSNVVVPLLRLLGRVVARVEISRSSLVVCFINDHYPTSLHQPILPLRCPSRTYIVVSHVIFCTRFVVIVSRLLL